MKNTQSAPISKVEITNEILSSRGGLVFFAKYIQSVKILSLLLGRFPKLKKSAKGVALANLFKQVLCFFMDGTNQRLSYFEELKEDAGYAAALENQPDQMASSHTMKRFFKAFNPLSSRGFRWILQQMFLWRLRLKRPEQIVLTLDTMVMDNDEALKRHGCDPTYKKVKGFQPLQLIWEGKIVDAIFRRGKRHSLFGNQANDLLENIVALIREKYDRHVPILVRLDSGFMDEKLFALLDELAVGFVATGKIYGWVKEKVGQIDSNQWQVYDNGQQRWSYASFRYSCESWQSEYRAWYAKPLYEQEQQLLEFVRPDNVILTNLEEGQMAWEYLSAQQREQWQKPETVIESHHQRGADELPHRGLKEFGTERLPFKRFGANQAYYYLMVISFFLFECFKEDNLEDVLPVSSYAKTVRRKLIDMAAKVVRKSHQWILKVSEAAMKKFNLEVVLSRCQLGPPIEVA